MAGYIVASDAGHNGDDIGHAEVNAAAVLCMTQAGCLGFTGAGCPGTYGGQGETGLISA